jgi:cystathionine gamma-lyase
MSGFTGTVSFELKGGAQAAERLITQVKLITHAPSFGGVESLIVCPTIMETHSMSKEEFDLVGVNAGLLRLSVGLEHERDLISDLEQALAAV